MNKFLVIAALSLFSSSAFADIVSMTIYGSSASEVEQKVATAVANIKANNLPMQLMAFKECTHRSSDWPKSVINKRVRKVTSITYNDNTYVMTADGSFRQQFSATLKVFCGKPLSR